MKVFAWICAGLMALAVIPAYADSGCSEKHENVSRFNPTELSDYQKCVYEWAGRTSGTHAGFVWFSIEGEFYHISNDAILANAGHDIEHLVAKTILESETAEKLVQYERDIETMSRLLGARNDKVLELQANLDTLQRAINAVKNASTNTTVPNYTFTNPVAGVLKYQGALRFGTISLVQGEGDCPAGSENCQTFNGRYYMQVIDNPVLTTGRTDLANLSNGLLNTIKNIAADAYNKGYADGYAQGYKDGFKAGVESVR